MAEPTKNGSSAAAAHSSEHPEAARIGCGLLGRFPVVSLLSFALVGIGIGVGLSYWEPDEGKAEDKEIVLQWLGLVGDMFIRALQIVVLPLIFINVIIAVVEMMLVGKAGTIGSRTILFYLATTCIAAIMGIISVLIFRGLFDEGDYDAEEPPRVSLGCNEPGAMVTETPDGTLMCSTDTSDTDAQDFVINDLNGNFVAASSAMTNQISLSDTLYQGVFEKLISNNIVGSFVEGNFAAVIVFAIAVGVALSRVLDKKPKDHVSVVMGLLKELDGMFQVMIRWIIAATPFAILSLIATAVGSQNNLADQVANVGYLILATLLGVAMHVAAVHYLLHFLVTRRNPWSYLKHIIPAQTMALACASSAATIPVTFRCVEATGRVPKVVQHFIIPLGATINMDGTAIYIPAACIWMAMQNGITPDLGNYILLVIISTIGSAGAAPVPAASLVMILTAYNTVFSTTGTPGGFSFILAIDWLLDRVQTAMNVSGDTVVASMVSTYLPEDELRMLEAKAAEKGLTSPTEPADSAREIVSVEVTSHS